MKRGKAIVLFSGGVDSTLALAWAIRSGYQPTVLEFDYEGRPEAEKRAAHTILRRLGSPPHVRLTLGASLRPDGETGGYLASQLPLHGMTAADRRRLAEELGAPVDLAWSCWKDGDRPCGRCEKCKERARSAPT
ncbi:MAG: 7-cyano-7-deazaguanine synthase [Euryarchaeota archaeon]|nr:7-cyano-7-deazaguanine synthase [Euryarchaeota archaeon]